MFKTREIAGWLLILFGLYLIRTALEFVGDRKVVEASVVVFASMFVFRGGIQLVKVATAASICLGLEQKAESTSYSE